MSATCATCRFWLGYESNKYEIGECRRYAPRPLESGTFHSPWRHPKYVHMIADAWCGEHQPKDAAPITHNTCAAFTESTIPIDTASDT